MQSRLCRPRAGQQSLYHAQRCLDLCQEYGVESFVVAPPTRPLPGPMPCWATWTQLRAERNLSYGAAIDLDDGDRAVIESDLSTLPIPG